MDAVLSLVAAGVGVAIVPETVADSRFRITRLQAPGLSRTVQLTRRAGVDLPRAAAELETRLLGLTR
jgi:DNA-binding transcriptional LysR family regulator